MYRINFVLIAILAVIHLADLFPQQNVLGSSTSIAQTPVYAQEKVQIKTTTAFTQTEISENETLPYETKYEKTKELDYGVEEVTTKGETGLKTYYYLLTHWGDEIIDKKLLRTETKDPITEVISLGTKITWRLLEGTEYGRLKYWHKMKVWATKYDANCEGCTGRTFSGTQVVKGVCATDPKVIPLGTNFYVEGYGLCRAEDIGGAIKGNKIDLGYVDASKGEWRTGYTNIYLLTSAPEE